MTKIRKKKVVKGKNVWEASLERVNRIYDLFDKVVVSFSGGKDSTAVLQVALKVAKERGKLPLEVVFFDEEAIHPPTIEYVHRVAANPDVDLKWYCLEFKHRNAASNEEPYWYCWDKDKKDLWVRPMPEQAITEHPNFKKGMSFQEFSPYLYDRTEGRIAMMTGVRTQESLRRYRAVAMRDNDHYIALTSDGGGNQYRCHPIYDWSSKDVWIGVKKFGWDYNKTYDLLNKTDMFNQLLRQRVCPPFGEEPLRGLYIYAVCFPEMWHKMQERVKGIKTAGRYANTELYSNATNKPEGITYKEYLNVIIDSYSGRWKKKVKKGVNAYIKKHYRVTDHKLRDEPHMLTGIGWRFLCRVAIRGDFKGRQLTHASSTSAALLKKAGLTMEEAKKLYGKKESK